MRLSSTLNPIAGLLAAGLVLLQTAHADLISDLRGQQLTILTPSSPGYADASTAFNRRFSFKPAAITFPSTIQQISTILSLTTKYHHQAVARSGGHSYIANGLGGKDGVVVVDMRHFTALTVDEKTHIASIGTGNRLGDVALGLNNHGRALPHGTCPYVGVGGHSGHGGYGFTSRKWGLMLDTISSMDVVLANGTILTASSSHYPDLFWALRGSSSSFGVVTTIYANTVPAPSSSTTFSYQWDMTPTQAATATDNFQKYARSTTLPPEFGAELVLRKGSSKGKVSFELTGGWYGPSVQYDSVIQRYLRDLSTPNKKTVIPGTYIESVKHFGGLSSGRLSTKGIPNGHNTFYAKSLMTPDAASSMSIKSLNAFYEYLANQGFSANTNWFVQIELYGGTNSAINKVALDATAFARRSSLFTIQFYTSTHNGLSPFPSQGFTLLDGMVDAIVKNNPLRWDYGAYTNYIDERLQNWQSLYYAAHYPKLKQLKKKYDPHDTFNFPLAIQE